MKLLRDDPGNTNGNQYQLNSQEVPLVKSKEIYENPRGDPLQNIWESISIELLRGTSCEMKIDEIPEWYPLVIQWKSISIEFH